MAKMPKGYRDHLRIVASTDNGRSIGRTSVILNKVNDDAVQKRKAKEIPVGEEA